MADNRDDEIRLLRERLEVLEGSKAEDAPTASEQASPKRKKRPAKDWIIGGGLALIALYVLVSLPGLIAADAEQTTAFVADPDGWSTPETEANAASNRTTLIDVGKWNYLDRPDPMTDRLTRTACVTSTNQVQLDFPYSNVTADLCLRDAPGQGLDAYVVLNGDGQIICRSYDRCTLDVRFDEDAVQSYRGSDAADGASHIVFINDAGRIATALKSADVTRVELTLYQAGTQALEFPTRKLEWPRPEAVD